MNETQKRNRLERAIRHAEHDRLISGQYVAFDELLSFDAIPRGCSVGCDAIDIQLDSGVDVDDITSEHCHALVAEHDGTPEWLEWLRDEIFERLADDHRSWWHVELARSLAGIEKDITSEMWRAFSRNINIRLLESVLEFKDDWDESVREVVASSIDLAIEYNRDPSESLRTKAQIAALNANTTACNAKCAEVKTGMSAIAAATTAVRSTEVINGKTCSYMVAVASNAVYTAASNSRLARVTAYKDIADSVIDVFRSEVILK